MKVFVFKNGFWSLFLRDFSFLSGEIQVKLRFEMLVGRDMIKFFLLDKITHTHKKDNILIISLSLD